MAPDTPDTRPDPTPDTRTEEVEKKEKSGGQPDETPDQVRARATKLRAANDKREKGIAVEEGTEAGAEKKTGRERLNEIIRQNLQVIMQEELGFNENTDFKARETPQLRQYAALIRESRAYVSSHTAESLSRTGALGDMLKTAFEQYKKENPNDATGAGLQNADREAAATIFRDALLQSLDGPEKKITDELKNRQIDVEGEREKRENDGEQLRVVRGTPNDRDFSRGSRNAIRDFRDVIQVAKATPGGKMYNQLMFEGPQTDDDRAAVRKLNVLSRKFDAAVAHCSENGVSAVDKNARASMLKEYGETLMKGGMEDPGRLPEFRDWITQNADKFKAAQERARKTAD